MASETLDHTLTSTTDEAVFTTRGWTQIWARLSSIAGGTNAIAMGSRFVEIEPGTVISQILAPGTEVKIKTSSIVQVKWSILTTDLRFLDILEQSLCGGAR